MGKSKLTDEQKSELFKKFENGEKISILSNEYNISESLIYSLTRDKNIIRQSQKYKHLNTNENFFENIKTEHQAYWLGFIVADAYIGNKYLQFALAYKDIYHLIQFSKDLNSTHSMKILFPKKQGSSPIVRMSIPRIKIVKDLNNLGFDNHKTGNEHFPSQLSPELYRHYIRGYFDGDGCALLIKNDKREDIYLSFCCANIDFLENIKDILIKTCNVNNNKISSHIGCYALSYKGNIQCTRICKYLWEDANIYLPRKIIPILNSKSLKENIKLGTFLDY